MPPDRKHVLLQTRRHERPRSSRDHHSNPTDVLYRFSTSAGPPGIRQLPGLSSGSPSLSRHYFMGRTPVLIGIILWGGTLKRNVTKIYGPKCIIFKHMLGGTPHGNNAGSRRGDSVPSVTIAFRDCLLHTSPSPRDGLLSRMPSSA